ncbi:MAG: ATP-binding protein [Deltaproteobacteria bacterium]|nr:ATP-binding protein [Deltaproteobacteria bacterium]
MTPPSAKKTRVSGDVTAVTDRERQDAAFRPLAEKAPWPVVLHRDGVVLFANQAMAVLTGHPDPKALVGTPLGRLVSPEEEETFLARARKMASGEAVSGHIRFSLARKGHPPVRVECRDYLVEWEDHPAVFTTFSLDSAHPERDEAAGHLLRKALNSLSIPVFAVDFDHCLVAANQQFLQLFHLPPQAARSGLPLHKIIQMGRERQPTNAADNLDVLEKIREMNHFFLSPFEYKNASGQVFEVRGNPLPGGGSVVALLDITQRKHAEMAMQESQQTLMGLMSDLPGMVYRGFHDSTRTMEFVSQGCRDLTGYQPYELIMNISSSYMELIHPRDRERVLDEIHQAIQEKRPYRLEYRLMTRDGVEKYVMESGHPLLDQGHGGAPLLEGFVNDITTRKQVEEDMKVAKELAEDSTRAKSEFLAVISHEIRTPMNVVIGMVDLLKETPLDDTQRRYVDVLENGGNTLMDLLNNVLDLSKVESGGFELEHISFHLPDLLDSAMELLAARARQKGLGINWDIAPGLPTHLVGDPGRLRQIISNLVGNAIKFTDRGGVFLQVAAPDPDEPGLLRFSVKDTGIGIPEDKQQAIFERFTQSDSSITRRYGGTGLGLSISQRFVELMGGKIWVSSRPEEGSTFYFTVRFHLPRESDPLPKTKTIQLNGMRVWLWNHRGEELNTLADDLRAMGGVVTCQTDLGELSALISQAEAQGEPPDVLVLDWPEENTHVAGELAVIRFHHPQLPFVVLGPPLEQDPLLGRLLAVRLEAELTSHNPPPHRLARLLLRMADLASQQHIEQPGKSTGAFKTPYTGKRVLLVEDFEDNRMLFRTFLQSRGYEIIEAANGLEGLGFFCSMPMDLVLMDLQMPIMDGFTAIRMIRQFEKERQIRRTPVMALTAMAFEEDQRRVLEMGCDGILSKPVKKKDFLDAVESILPPPQPEG